LTVPPKSYDRQIVEPPAFGVNSVQKITKLHSTKGDCVSDLCFLYERSE
jgi:hypothetical protein